MARVDSLYELLEVSSAASTEEIEASYQRILAFLGPESLAVYAMLDDGEADALRGQIDAAYHTLRDSERRAAYDHAREATGVYPNLVVTHQAPSDPNLSVGLVRREASPPPREAPRRDDLRREESWREEAWRDEPRRDEPRRDEPAAAPAPRDEARRPRDEERGRMVTNAALQALEGESEGAALIAATVASSRSVAPIDGKRRRRLQPRAVLEVGPDTEFSGSLLRRLRESADATLEDLAEITKVSKRYLTALEENDFDTLPAFVYVRGFVSEYARALGLDSKLVANSYMSLYRRYRGESG